MKVLQNWHHILCLVSVLSITPNGTYKKWNEWCTAHFINSTLTTSVFWDILKKSCLMCLSKLSPNWWRGAYISSVPQLHAYWKSFRCLLGGKYGSDVSTLQGRKEWLITHVGNVNPAPDFIRMKVVQETSVTIYSHIPGFHGLVCVVIRKDSLSTAFHCLQMSYLWMSEMAWRQLVRRWMLLDWKLKFQLLKRLHCFPQQPDHVLQAVVHVCLSPHPTASACAVVQTHPPKLNILMCIVNTYLTILCHHVCK